MAKKSTYQFPVVHLNGTSAKDLVEVREAAFDALVAAYNAVRAIAPNGRDYYPDGLTAVEKAIEQHIDRLDRIDAIMEELQAEIAHIEEYRR